LEDLSKNFEKSINELKKLYETIIEDKEKLKLQIQKVFTKIRSILNEKEDQLLIEADEKFNNIFFKEDIIKEDETFPKKIKVSLEKGKLLNKEWNDNNLCKLITDCIYIENNILKIKEFNKYVNYNNLNKYIKIIFDQEEEQITELSNSIKSFGKIRVEEEMN